MSPSSNASGDADVFQTVEVHVTRMDCREPSVNGKMRQTMIALTERSARLAAVARQSLPKCVTYCVFLLIGDPGGVPTWRCENCLRYLAQKTGQGELF